MTIVAIPSEQMVLKRVEERVKSARESAPGDWRRRLRDLVPQVHWITRLVRDSWYELTPNVQDGVIRLRHALDNGTAQNLTGAAKIQQAARSLWSILTEPLSWPLIFASGRFLRIVNEFLAEETYRRRQIDRAMETDPDLIALIERGEDDFAHNRVTECSPEEFLRRFS